MAESAALYRFYASKAWNDLRNRRILETNGRCERCGRDCSDDLSKLVGHHKVRLTDETLADPSVALNPENIEVLCMRCHNIEHERTFGSKRRQVFLVYGPPLSGKTTYVLQHAGPEDLIVDLDRIGAAVGNAPLYERRSGVKAAVFLVRDVLYDHIRTRGGAWPVAWVIGGFPRKDERERLASRLGASMIRIEAEEGECLARLYHDDSRPLIWEDYIKAWFRDANTG